MTHIVRTVTVPTPIGRVAPYLSDFATTEEWDPHTESCRRLDDGTLHVGSRFENVQSGSKKPFVYTVEEYEPGRRIVLTGDNGRMDTRDELTFTPTPDGGTAVRYTVDITLHGLRRAGQPLMPLIMKRIADDAEDGMRERLLQL